MKKSLFAFIVNHKTFSVSSCSRESAAPVLTHRGFCLSQHAAVDVIGGPVDSDFLLTALKLSTLDDDKSDFAVS